MVRIETETEWTDDTYGRLHDYATGECLRPATRAEALESLQSGPEGAFRLDGRTVYVDGGGTAVRCYGLWDGVDTPLSDAARAAIAAEYRSALAVALDVDDSQIELHDHSGTTWIHPALDLDAGDDIFARAWDMAWDAVTLDDDGDSRDPMDWKHTHNLIVTSSNGIDRYPVMRYEDEHAPDDARYGYYTRDEWDAYSSATAYEDADGHVRLSGAGSWGVVDYWIEAPK